jgi:GNAT superfamily N-acetyltransferase
MSNEISIRKAKAADIRLISAVATVSFYEAYFEQDDPHGMAHYLAESFGENLIAAEVADPINTFFLAYRGSSAVGYAKLRDASVHESVDSANAIELQRLYLVERVWGKGVGDLALEHCIEYARELGKDTLWLGVWEENKRARSFYKRYGFDEVGTLEFPYGKDEVGTNKVLKLAI